jgi:thiol-disulfide isomerase/thioredoxin
MTKLLPLLALMGIAPLAFAGDLPKPPMPAEMDAALASAEKVAAAIATPLDQRTAEQKALIYAKIQADNRARAEKERLGNIREMATVRAENVDLAKLLDGHLTDADGKPVSIDTISKARYVAFYHSASWCCGCKQFTPALLEAARKYAPGDVAFVFVSWDKPGAETQTYLQKSGMPWPTVPKSSFANSPARLAIRSIPHLRVYDAAGALVADSLNDRGQHGSYDQQFAALDKLAATKPETTKVDAK